MRKIYLAFFLLCGTVITACKPPEQPYMPDYKRGQEIYRVFCAECHDSGKLDAPMLDQPEDWPAGALVFPSVLKDHATQGFLNMPGRGGHSQLTDRNVQDAVHYMLRQIASEED